MANINETHVVYRARGIWEKRGAASERSAKELRQEELLGEVYWSLLDALQRYDVFDEEKMQELIAQGREKVGGFVRDELALGAVLFSEAISNAQHRRRDISV